MEAGYETEMKRKTLRDAVGAAMRKEEQTASATIKWRDIKSLLTSLGAEVTEGHGSRVRIALNGRKAVFHRPHPSPDTDKGAVKSMRRFLIEAGVSP